MAMGARRSHVLRMVITDGIKPVIAGLALGILSVFGLNKALATGVRYSGMGGWSSEMSDQDAWEIAGFLTDSIRTRQASLASGISRERPDAELCVFWDSALPAAATPPVWFAKT